MRYFSLCNLHWIDSVTGPVACFIVKPCAVCCGAWFCLQRDLPQYQWVELKITRKIINCLLHKWRNQLMFSGGDKIIVSLLLYLTPKHVFGNFVRSVCPAAALVADLCVQHSYCSVAVVKSYFFFISMSAGSDAWSMS